MCSHTLACFDPLNDLADCRKLMFLRCFLAGILIYTPSTCLNFFSSGPEILTVCLRLLFLLFDLLALRCLPNPRRRKSFPVLEILILRIIDFLIFNFVFFICALRVLIYFCLLFTWRQPYHELPS